MVDESFPSNPDKAWALGTIKSWAARPEDARTLLPPDQIRSQFAALTQSGMQPVDVFRYQSLTNRLISEPTLSPLQRIELDALRAKYPLIQGIQEKVRSASGQITQ